MRIFLSTVLLAFCVPMVLVAEDGAAEDGAADKEEGFVSLFDGKTLNGWVGATKGYFVEDEQIICDPKSGGNLFTEKEYQSFILRLEFKVPPGGNNGIGIRAPKSGDVAYSGMEIQVLDDEAPQYKNLKEYQYHGSLYGLVSAKRGHLKPTGQWNFQEVRVEGDKIQVILNGTKIVDADMSQVRSNPTLDGKEHPGIHREKGHIGFLGHGSAVAFRNIRIREL